MKISKSFKYYCLHISVVVLNASVTSLCIGCNHPVIISLLGGRLFVTYKFKFVIR